MECTKLKVLVMISSQESWTDNTSMNGLRSVMKMHFHMPGDLSKRKDFSVVLPLDHALQLLSNISKRTTLVKARDVYVYSQIISVIT